MTEHYRIYFHCNRTDKSREQYKLRYAGKEVQGSSIREGLSKLSRLLDDEDAVDVEVDWNVR